MDTKIQILKDFAKSQGIKVIDMPLMLYDLDEFTLYGLAEVIRTCQRLVQEHQKKLGKERKVR